MDYTFRRHEGWYAAVNRGGQRQVRGPFWWAWIAELACWVP